MPTNILQIRKAGTAWLSIALVVCCILATNAPSASAWEYVKGPPRTEEIRWGLTDPQPKNQRLLRIYFDTGYCYGEQPPFFHHFLVRERPHRAIITAYLRFPTPIEVSGTVEPGEAKPSAPVLASAGRM